MDFSERTRSSWKADMAPLRTAALRENLRCDVCIVGAGMAGMSVAYELCRDGRKVVVLDDNCVGGGETAQSTAHLASALDERFVELERMHGESGARIAYESHASAIDRIEAIIMQESIECDFQRRNAYLFLAPGQLPDLLDRELAAAWRAGLHGAQLLTGAPDRELMTGPCLFFPHQAQMHPLRYVAGLLRAVQSQGGRVYTRTHVRTIHEPHGDSAGWVETSSGMRVQADVIVVATNTPINDRVAIHTKQAAYRTYVVAFAQPRERMLHGLYWDTGDPYHYVRSAPPPAGSDEALLIVGGEDHRTGHGDQGRERLDALIDWTRQRIPDLGEPRYEWSGQVLEPVDGLGFIGHNPGSSDRVYVATGDSGNGITHGAIAGMLIRDLIEGSDNRWTSLYDPARKSLKSLDELMRNNASVAASYVQWLGAPGASSLDDIPRGQGRIVQHGVRKLAVYRDDDGRLEVCSAACPHLGGVLHWNGLERSWDCPLHGSRFDVHGEVLNGPACNGLQVLPLSAAEKTRRAS
ncbi:MAG TPA: FAD-dependent oxidoreductase [Polyangiales bacterium]|jgi:glycine/D-amino acid oxidase-like deaminating enzyme/nitrite reductase/ring-hydroxylating ferredoxin subunit|nr:FAD-dependent oxidoreductase [Polyangiales bacterium]